MTPRSSVPERIGTDPAKRPIREIVGVDPGDGALVDPSAATPTSAG